MPVWACGFKSRLEYKTRVRNKAKAMLNTLVFLLIVASVYILFSKQIDQCYIGSCLDLATRLEFHQNKVFKNAFTRRANDWELYFEIPDLSFEAARKIETHIKNMKSRVYLQNLTNYPEISLKLTLKFGASSSR